ncbi:MAG: ATP-binding protein [Phycisphaerae bacterium]|jgi:hypothetical protein
MTTPVEHAGHRTIGTIASVAPNEFTILLDTDAPGSTALNAGYPAPFPRINGYVLVPNEVGSIVCLIAWLGIENAPYPKRLGLKDFGLVDLPYPVRKMKVLPVATLRRLDSDEVGWEVERGVRLFPTVGDSVLLPTREELRHIVEGHGRDARVPIGTAPLAGAARVSVDPDKVFGRHLAVLGNTGSGKSCTVAGLIRWSLEAARDQQQRIGQADVPTARFIVLDPNGEYSRAFATEKSPLKARIFKVNPEAGERPLQVPLWFWNSAEWIAFTKASVKTQKPTLVEALRFVRDDQTGPAQGANHEIRRFLRTIVVTIRAEKNTGSPWGAFPKPKSFFEKIEKWKTGLESQLAGLTGNEADELKTLVDCIETLCVPRRRQYAHYDFTLQEVTNLLEVAGRAHSAFGGSDADYEPVDADVPRPFTSDSLLRSVEATAEMMNVSEHVETLLIRLRSLLADAQMKSIIADCADLTLEKWLKDYIGGGTANDGCLSIIDLSLVPSEIVHVVTAVTARMVFEALQRYRRINGGTLPTVLVMEEAHTFVKRYKDDLEDQDAATVCCQVFERIAREGRKFGLGLVLSSQRPSELSATVLAQCNTFLLHRIVNDRDQELVQRLVPDNLGGLLKELPTLPTRQAILLGWATPVPVLVEIHDLPKGQRPDSEDPGFWDSWCRQDGAPFSWQPIADAWQGIASRPSDEDGGQA